MIALIGLGLFAFGVLSIMAGAMSDAPSAGENSAKLGAWCAGSGLLLIVAQIVILVARYV